MADNWYAGNANQDAGQYRGWLLGHFIDAPTSGPRSTEALEVKWGIPPQGIPALNGQRATIGPPCSCSSRASSGLT